MISIRVTCYHVSDNDQEHGSYNTNPRLNSVIYDVSFLNGVVNQYTTNTIVEALYSTVDDDGHSKAVLDYVLYHAKNDKFISKTDKYIHTKDHNMLVYVN